MKLVTSTIKMQHLAKRWKAAGQRIGLVPTMGALHAGHQSLITRGRKSVGPEGKVVVSIYVNPTQFGPGEDWGAYPRDLKGDQRLCREAGADVVFAPRDADIYPRIAQGFFSTYVIEERLSRRMEGASRPDHFRGVTTIVAKLFNLILPDLAVFGAKDFQQAAVIQRMTADLNFPVKIIVAPTCREPDGLALSSRNRYLSASERQQAVVLWQSIQRANEAVRRSGAAIPATRLKKQLAKYIEQRPAAKLDYIEFFDPLSLLPVSGVKTGVQIALAVFIGRTRLIDNACLR